MDRDYGKYNGIFVPSDGVGFGHLVVDGRNSLLTLVDENPLPIGGEWPRDIHGALADGKPVSLLNCIRTSFSDTSWQDGRQHQLFIFPNYVAVGYRHINGNDPIIAGMRMQLRHIESLIPYNTAYGTIRPERDEFIKLLENEQSRHNKIAEEHGWGTSDDIVEVGDYPQISYFSGEIEIAKFETSFGSVRVENLPTTYFSPSSGRDIEKAIFISIDFSKPFALEDVMRHASQVQSFLELCLGASMPFEQLELFVSDKDSDGEVPPFAMQLFRNFGKKYADDGMELSRDFDILVDIGRRREEFEQVAAAWLKTNAILRDARWRLSNGFLSGSYTFDRLVAAANMFDLLPVEYVPRKIEIDEQTSHAAASCREIFRALPDTTLRQSMLQALGRLGTATLREKICHRAQFIIREDPDRFQELEVPCRQAVICRNHFVHGSEGTFDYLEHLWDTAFLTETLEFVFAISDLIELGWNYSEWLDNGTTLSHPFARYVYDFSGNLSRLKALI